MTIWDGMAKIIGGGFPGEEKVSYKEHKVHEGPELDFPLVDGVLNVFTRPEAEVEANGDQVVDVVGSGVVGAGCSSADGVNYSQGDGFFSLDGGILDPIGLEFTCEALVDTGVCLRVGWFYGVGKTIQGVGRCNCPPMPEKPILSYIGPSSAWSTWRAKYGGRRLGGARCEGWMNIGE